MSILPRKHLPGTPLPLFLRVFGLMMLTLLLVQAFNFALVLLVPPPRPAITTIAHVAAALQRGKGEGLLVRTNAAPPAGGTHGPRATALRAALAQRLDMAVEDIELRMEDPFPGPPEHLLGVISGMPSGMRGPPRQDHDLQDGAMLFGDFTLTAKVDGQWRTLRPARSEVQPWRWRALLWLLAAMLVVAPFAWVLARGVARPFGLFADAAERLGRDPRAPSLSIEGPREIAHASAAFNEMQARLNRYVEDRTMLMAAIAHDLRTPLMRLGLRLEDSPPALRTACEGDIDEMEHMIGAVMAFLRDLQPLRRQRLDLRSLAQTVADQYQDMGEDVKLEDGAPVILEGDSTALKALIANLVGNAVKYAGPAIIRLEQSNREAVIEVSDEGPGMTQDDLERAFDPFFRGERSRNRDTGGIGLGLASVRAVALAHGGQASLANRTEGGLLARITLPR